MSALPPIDTVPILFIRFTTKLTESLSRYLKDRLEEEGIIVFEEKDSDGVVSFGLTTKKYIFEHEAERCKLFKYSTLKGVPEALKHFEGSKFMRPFEVMNRHTFINQEVDDHSVYDSERLFTSADRVKVTFSTIEGLPVFTPDEKSSNLVFELNKTIQIPQEQMFETYSNWTLIDTLQDNGFIQVFAPMHSEHIKKIWMTALDPRSAFPVEELRSYYGEKHAFYFAWLRFYTGALFFPGISGLLLYLIRTFYTHDSVDTCALIPFHGLITFIWAVAFIQFWIRHEHDLAYNWGTSKLLPLSDLEESAFSIRHQFKGKMRRSEVTGTMKKYYPSNLRRLKYAWSALITLLLLTGAFFVMIASLNMQGLIQHHHNDAGDGEDDEHPFFFPIFASLSGEGAIFDAKSTFFSYFPVLGHVLLIAMMNSGYRKVAKKLTDWENHETQAAYENSMVIKRFWFEASDCYLVLFYLAFFEQDVVKVRSELVSVFHVDTIRRLFVEGVVPYISQKLAQKKKKKHAIISKKRDEVTHSYQSFITENAGKEHYDQFDDYIEMIIQLGYITLFASAYPLAPFVAIIANFIELRLDVFKLTFVSMRPKPMPFSDIGSWKVCIKVIVWMSAITNCFIFCFSSMQMFQYVPEYFTVDKSGEHDLKLDSSGMSVIFLLFGIERALVVLGLLIDLFIPDLPEDVVSREKRKQYVDFRLHQEIRSKKKKVLWEKKIKALFAFAGE